MQKLNMMMAKHLQLESDTADPQALLAKEQDMLHVILIVPNAKVEHDDGKTFA